MLFQGYPERVFSLKNRSFRITNLYDDDFAASDWNYERFRNRVARHIIRKLAILRNADYDLPIISPTDIRFKTPALSESMGERTMCGGRYDLFPEVLVCSKCGRTSWASKDHIIDGSVESDFNLSIVPLNESSLSSMIL